jgi:hypothetical protein
VSTAALCRHNGNSSSHDFFSARMGCQVFGVYGMDLTTLCIKNQNRR